jgi:hypothetical protein
LYLGILLCRVHKNYGLLQAILQVHYADFLISYSTKESLAR